MLIIFCNFIADLPGPVFLVLYLITIIIAVVFFMALRGIVESLNNNTLSSGHSKELTPYEVAYLRGGVVAVINLIIFNLMQKGLLERDEKYSSFKIKKSESQDNIHLINSIEKKVLAQFSEKSGIELKKIREDKALFDYIEENIDYKSTLEEQGLLLLDGYKRIIKNFRNILFLVVIGLGAYKVFVALSRGYTNVLFLIILGVIGAVILLRFGISRLTKRGKAHLSYLQDLYESTKSSLGVRLRNSNSSEVYAESSDLLLGIYGLSLLSETDTYADFGQEFAQDKSAYYSDGWGSCGGACSSGSSCGSSCSGGCGGGCGGCGGCGG